MGVLGIDTAVEGGEGHYVGHVAKDWEIWGPNGGYLAAMALRAAGRHCGRERPVSLTCQFLRPGRFEDLHLHTETLRATRRAEAVRVVARQGDDDILSVLVWGVDGDAGLVHRHAPIPPDIDPDPAALPTMAELLDEAGLAGSRPPFRFWENFDARPLDFWADWATRPVTAPRTGGWYQFVPSAPTDDPWADAARPIILADTFTWPAAVRAHPPQEDWIAPSLDLTVQLHEPVNDAEWLLVVGEAPVAHAGVIGCSSRVWAPDGRLAAIGGGTLLCVPTGR